MDSPGAEAETTAERISEALGAILQSQSGGISKGDSALRVRAVRSFDQANRRALGLIESAEQALEEERRERQRRSESEDEDRARRREYRERMRDRQERRKDIRAIVEAEERMTACRDRSRREAVLLAMTVTCVLATVALLFVTVLRGEPELLGGSVFSSLLSVGGGSLLRAREEPASGAATSER